MHILKYPPQLVMVGQWMMVIDWNDAPPAPEMVACTRRRVRLKESCSCLQSDVKCTYFCKLTTHDNQDLEMEELAI